MIQRQEFDSPEEEYVLGASVIRPRCICFHHVLFGHIALAFPGIHFRFRRKDLGAPAVPEPASDASSWLCHCQLNLPATMASSLSRVKLSWNWTLASGLRVGNLIPSVL